MGDYFLLVGFGSIRFSFYIKKVIKSNFILKKNRNPTDRFQFGFLEEKRFKPVWFCFSVRFRFFFLFGFGSVQFFRFQIYKTETEPVGFFKILISFFLRFIFFSYFFYFLGLIDFLIFLFTPALIC
jgi:hypothetical protein